MCNSAYNLHNTTATRRFSQEQLSVNIDVILVGRKESLFHLVNIGIHLADIYNPRTPEYYIYIHDIYILQPKQFSHVFQQFQKARSRARATVP